MRKRLAASALAGLLLLSGAEPASAASLHGDAITDDGQAGVGVQIEAGEPTGFTDNKPGAHLYAQVSWMKDRGLSVGYTDGSFGVGRNITRGELASLMYRYADPEAEADQTETDLLDVKPESTHLEAITWAAGAGLVHGYADRTFRPSRSITRGELSSMVHRYAGKPSPGIGGPTFPDVGHGSHSGAIAWLAGEGIIDGYEDGSFQPGQSITRGEVAKILHGYALQHEERPLVDLGGGVKIWAEKAEPGGRVSLNPDQVWTENSWPARLVPEYRDPYGPDPIADRGLPHPVSQQQVNGLPGVTVEPGEARIVWHGLDHADDAEMHTAREISFDLLWFGFGDLEIFWQDERPGTEVQAYYSTSAGLAWAESDAIWLQGEGWWWENDPGYAARVAVHEALHHLQFRLVDADGAPAGVNAVNASIASITGIATDPAHALLACVQDRLPGQDVLTDPRCTADPAWDAATTAIMQGRLP